LLFTVGTHTLQSIFTVICSSEHHTHTHTHTQNSKHSWYASTDVQLLVQLVIWNSKNTDLQNYRSERGIYRLDHWIWIEPMTLALRTTCCLS